MVPVGSFVALDVETANSDRGSICQIGLVRFERGREVASLSMLIDPEVPFNPMNTSIHGICADRVNGRPTWVDVHDTIEAWIGSQIVVSHSEFDRSALAQTCARYGKRLYVWIWVDSVVIAEKLWTPPYKLIALAERFGIPLTHHDALSDARAAGLLMARALKETDRSCLSECALTPQSPTPGRAQKAVSPTPRNVQANQYRVRATRSGCGNGGLRGQVIVFTGDLSIDRSAAADLAANAGADVKDNVSRKTTMLVVGARDLLPGWQAKSTKHRRAEELIAGGCAICIISEDEFTSRAADIEDSSSAETASGAIPDIAWDFRERT